jgi:hypothetical protein
MILFKENFLIHLCAKCLEIQEDTSRIYYIFNYLLKSFLAMIPSGRNWLDIFYYSTIINGFSQILLFQ